MFRLDGGCVLPRTAILLQTKESAFRDGRFSVALSAKEEIWNDELFVKASLEVRRDASGGS